MGEARRSEKNEQERAGLAVLRPCPTSHCPALQCTFHVDSLARPITFHRPPRCSQRQWWTNNSEKRTTKSAELSSQLRLALARSRSASPVVRDLDLGDLAATPGERDQHDRCTMSSRRRQTFPKRCAADDDLDCALCGDEDDRARSRLFLPCCWKQVRSSRQRPLRCGSQARRKSRNPRSERCTHATHQALHPAQLAPGPSVDRFDELIYLPGQD